MQPSREQIRFQSAERVLIAAVTGPSMHSLEYSSPFYIEYCAARDEYLNTLAPTLDEYKHKVIKAILEADEEKMARAVLFFLGE